MGWAAVHSLPLPTGRRRVLRVPPLHLAYANYPPYSQRSGTVLARTSRDPRKDFAPDRPRHSPPAPVAGPTMAAASPAEDEDLATAADLRFEAPLKIAQYPDPVLRARNKRINAFDDSLRSLADEMFDVMYRTGGIGLSAPQVGVNVQLMVFNPAGVKGKGEEIVLVNPGVSKFSKRLVGYEEGCLSFPGICANVLRPDTVKIDAQDGSGAKI